MKKIESLTPEQEAKFPEYVKKWVDIGINTDRLDFAETEKIVNNFRQLIEKKPAPLMIVENPIEAWVVCCLHEQNVPIDQLEVEMRTVFKGNPKNYIIPTGFLPYQTGSLFASVFSFYDYMIEELQIDIEKDLYVKYKTWEATSKLGCIYPFDDLTIVCQKPTTIHLNENNVLHCDGGPALEYSGEGDFKIYSLNGVVVPEYLAVTPAHELDLEMYNKETNADIKAEFVRKVGIERFLEKGVLIDSYKNYNKSTHKWWYKSEYELWDMKSLFPTLVCAPFVKMLNPTTKIWHMEGVSPDCKDLLSAIRERFGGRDMTIINAA